MADSNADAERKARSSEGEQTPYVMTRDDEYAVGADDDDDDGNDDDGNDDDDDGSDDDDDDDDDGDGDDDDDDDDGNDDDDDGDDDDDDRGDDDNDDDGIRDGDDDDDDNDGRDDDDDDDDDGDGRGDRDDLDVINLRGAFDDYVISIDDDRVTVSGLGETFRLDDDIDRLDFTNGTLALDINVDQNAGTAYRAYQAAFDREPDDDGLSFWINALDNGTSFEDMAQGFIAAAEFQRVYGSNVSNDVYINNLYVNILGRGGDDEGASFWTGLLDRGEADRADVLLGFADAPENVALVAQATDDGIFFDG